MRLEVDDETNETIWETVGAVEWSKEYITTHWDGLDYGEKDAEVHRRKPVIERIHKVEECEGL